MEVRKRLINVEIRPALAAKKQKILESIKDVTFSNFLYANKDNVSVKTLKLLAKIDSIVRSYSKIYKDLCLDGYFAQNPSLDTLVVDIINILRTLIEKIPQKEIDYSKLFPDDPQYEDMKPYVDFLVSQLKIPWLSRPIFLDFLFYDHEGLQGTRNEFYSFFQKNYQDLNFLEELFKICPPEMFTRLFVDFKGEDFLSPDLPVALFLAGFVDGNEGLPPEILIFKYRIAELLPKIRQRPAWNTSHIGVNARREQLGLLLATLSTDDLRRLEAAACEKFLLFLAPKNVMAAFKKLSADQRRYFILGRNYTWESIKEPVSPTMQTEF